ncbi:uncharacterized protein YgbK (DUF1537 family) [Saccharopolyspora lacisalsi]|uniref:Uncharacterized protein YgbK (DUF1537 family) n=1 Tax=Halosaccharopolyspora lacisalsi TaxID=1000566 RepID=A0A839DY88_9PSEU|nr:four-carbon acid sugar kinase family protein [Halosaccharopolyspora lacisalsi]MBA8824191.1 uncharacterized protein YgbK (DUF1537 family) [Halosaccharopolyspora lacisalsi]
MTCDVTVVADDLTGANDTAVQFARQGWATLLTLSPDSDPAGKGVLALSTDARSAGDDAVRITAEAVTHLLTGGVEHLYVKIDSTMRGSVTAQVDGALRAWSAVHEDAFAVVCPAYPGMGRTVVDGTALVDGERLESTPAGRDPVTPVRSSTLADLLPGSTHVQLPDTRDPELLASELAGHGRLSRVLTLDAQNDEELTLIAQALARLGRKVVPVGSAGLANALATTWRPAGGSRDLGGNPDSARTGPVVVLVTSLHKVARAQEERLRESGGSDFLHLAPDLDDLLDEESFASWCTARFPPGNLPAVVLVTAPDERPDKGTPVGNTVAQRLADLVARLHAHQPASAVIVTGGDGARALVDRWECTGIAVRDAVCEGIPSGFLVGGAVDGLRVITKAGGFGASDALVSAVRHADTC